MITISHLVKFSTTEEHRPSAKCKAHKETVFVREMSCEEPIEKLYSAKFTDIMCLLFCSSCSWNDKEQYYPQCEGCGDKHLSVTFYLMYPV